MAEKEEEKIEPLEEKVVEQTQELNFDFSCKLYPEET